DTATSTSVAHRARMGGADDAVRPGGQERRGDRRLGHAPLPGRRRCATRPHRHDRSDPGARARGHRCGRPGGGARLRGRAHAHGCAGLLGPAGTCSCWHGVTTVVMGNCGFTLAPCAASDKHLVMRNVERAEDIAAEAMDAGIDWTWTTFPEFLDRVASLPKGINYACYIGHSAGTRPDRG